MKAALLLPLLLACSASVPAGAPGDVETLMLEASLDILLVRHGLPPDSPCHDIDPGMAVLERDMAKLDGQAYCFELAHSILHLVADCYESEYGRKWGEGEHPDELFYNGVLTVPSAELELRARTHQQCEAAQ